MSYEEKSTWVYLSVAIGTFTTYAVVILARADAGSLSAVPYVSTLLWTVGIGMVLSALARGAIDRAYAGQAHRSDERDRSINQRGEHVGGIVVGAAMIVPFTLAAIEADHFWIANAIYAGFILQAVTSSVVKLVGYRRGF
jgi:hypothetical protein